MKALYIVRSHITFYPPPDPFQLSNSACLAI